MCGIAGEFRFDDAVVAPETIKRLTQLLSHRGPDETGHFFRERYGCGVKRLAIIDLEHGSQPILRRNDELVIIYNGELYNYREIRESLISKGYQFRTSSDTEVVLAAYEEWGEECLDRFNGMFAFAIYDVVKEELFLARDRMGIKQLYYYSDGNIFVFGSEMKVLLSHPDVPRRLNLTAFSEYLTYGYCVGKETAVTGVSLLEPGHWMKVRSDGRIETRSYWEIPLQERDGRGSHKESAEEAYSLLVDAVRKRLVADVDVCVMLSSGLDSSSLAHIIQRELRVPLKAFTIGFEEPEFDESKDAGALAADFGMDWEKDFVRPKDVVTDFEDIVYHADSLQGNTAQIVYYYCSKLIHERGYKVALNGSGGDELFVGYPTYQADSAFRFYRMFPSLLKAGIRKVASILPVSHNRIGWDYKIKKFCEFEGRDTLAAHAYWRTIFTPEDQKALFREEHHGGLGNWYRPYDEYFRRCGDIPFLNKVQTADFYCWLMPLLSWVDNIPMAHSVELRVPFLDHRLVEMVMTLPPRLRFRGWGLKRMVKTYLKDRLPRKALRITKRGTHIPLGRWLNGELGGLAKEYLSADKVNRLDLFNMTQVEKLIQEHADGRKDNTFGLWNLIMFSAWVERFDIAA